MGSPRRRMRSCNSARRGRKSRCSPWGRRSVKHVSVNSYNSAIGKRDTLIQEIKEYESKNTELQQRLQECETYSNLKSDNYEAILRQLEENKQDYNTRMVEFNNLQQSHMILNNALEEMKKEKNTISGLLQECKTLNNTELQNEIKKLTDYNSSINQQIILLNSEKLEFTGKLEVAKTELMRITEVNITLTKQLEDNSKLLLACDAEKETMKEQLLVNGKELQNLREEITQLNNDINTLKAQIQDKITENSTLQNDLNKCTAEKGTLEENNKELYNKAIEDIDELTNKITGMEKEISDNKTLIDECAELRKLIQIKEQNNNQDLEEEKQSLQKLKNEIGEINKELQNNMMLIERELEDTKTELNSVKAEKQELEEKLTRCNENLSKNQQLLGECRTERANLEQSCKDDKGFLKKINDRLIKQIELQPNSYNEIINNFQEDFKYMGENYWNKNIIDGTTTLELAFMYFLDKVKDQKYNSNKDKLLTELNFVPLSTSVNRLSKIINKRVLFFEYIDNGTKVRLIHSIEAPRIFASKCYSKDDFLVLFSPIYYNDQLVFSEATWKELQEISPVPSEDNELKDKRDRQELINVFLKVD
jgi:chromosome segregation ATPase